MHDTWSSLRPDCQVVQATVHSMQRRGSPGQGLALPEPLF